MKYMTVILLFFMILDFGNAQEQPIPLVMTHLLDFDEKTGPSDQLMTQNLYLLGWNKDGQALLAKEKRLVPQSPQMIFILWDAVEDKLIWSQTLAAWGKPSEESLWWAGQQDFLGKLKKDNNIEDSDYQMGVFPLILEDSYYWLSLQKQRSSPTALITQLRVRVKASGLGIKTVADKKGLWQWAEVAGFIPSPFEDRILLVVAVQPVGWLGDKEPLDYLLVGIHLRTGFSLDSGADNWF